MKQNNSIITFFIKRLELYRVIYFVYLMWSICIMSHTNIQVYRNFAVLLEVASTIGLVENFLLWLYYYKQFKSNNGLLWNRLTWIDFNPTHDFKCCWQLFEQRLTQYHAAAYEICHLAWFIVFNLICLYKTFCLGATRFVVWRVGVVLEKGFAYNLWNLIRYKQQYPLHVVVLLA